MWPFLNKIKSNLRPGAAAYMEYFFLLFCSQYFYVKNFSLKTWKIPERQFADWLASESKKIGRQNFKQINTNHDLDTIDLIGEVVENICYGIAQRNEYPFPNSADEIVENNANDLAMLIMKSYHNSSSCEIGEWTIILRNATSAGVSIINLAVAKLRI